MHEPWTSAHVRPPSPGYSSGETSAVPPTHTCPPAPHTPGAAVLLSGFQANPRVFRAAVSGIIGRRAPESHARLRHGQASGAFSGSASGPTGHRHAAGQAALQARGVLARATYFYVTRENFEVGFTTRGWLRRHRRQRIDQPEAGKNPYDTLPREAMSLGLAKNYGLRSP